MVYIDIPYAPENDRIDKDLMRKNLDALAISDEAKDEAFRAIYNFQPRGVFFAENDLRQAVLLEETLRKLGVGYCQKEHP